MDKYRQKWSREETILAFDLYCKVPFSKIVKSNKDIIKLAEILGRTPSSVGLKMANLAACDPSIKAKNLHGMRNNSKLDQEIFDEFSSDWEELSYQAQMILSKLTGNTQSEIDIEMIPEGDDRTAQVKTRVGQYFFRTAVLTAYGSKCCVTGVHNPILLTASHIKPWKVSDSKTERTNPSNGLCLNALHDRAFDQGLITIDSSYKIVLSKEIMNTEMDQETRSWFLYYKDKQISLPDRFLPGKEFIEYHNDVIFRG